VDHGHAGGEDSRRKSGISTDMRRASCLGHTGMRGGVARGATQVPPARLWSAVAQNAAARRPGFRAEAVAPAGYALATTCHEGTIRIGKMVRCGMVYWREGLAWSDCCAGPQRTERDGAQQELRAPARPAARVSALASPAARRCTTRTTGVGRCAASARHAARAQMTA
jgi:hypothetical protein